MENNYQIDELDIAIIGMSGRFPGANNIEQFWQNLQDGVEAIHFFTDEELLVAGIKPQVLDNPRYVKAKPIIEDVEFFDAAFFGFNPREAELLDPQQRLFLECAGEALEIAGYAPAEGSIGVYAGASMSSYLLSLYANSELVAATGKLILHGNTQDFLSTRVSYKLNLKGPSYTVQTACSTSLVAIHLACQSLLNSECDLALAGGVSIVVPQTTGYLYQEEGILSPDGHCRAFDAQSQGTIFGNGVGVVLLKRLKDAIADGDYVHAVIKGSATNNDGSLKVSYAAPSVDGQAEVIVEALANAGVEPDTVTYIETHGTGTSLGDPIEIQALNKAFRARTKKTNFCAIGSVKPNIGHLDRAAGVASLIKAVLCLQHKQIPPTLNFQQPNPEIDFANSPFYVNTRLSAWSTNGNPRRAGVSSFGIGGTNAHVILEEAPTVEPSGTSRPWHLLLISAKTASALETATTNLVTHLQQHPDLNIADVAYTLAVGRRTFEHHRIVVCDSLNDAVNTLSSLNTQRVFTNYQKPCNRSVVFMFPGQGSQYINMGQELYETEPIFREQVAHCCRLLQPHLGCDLRSILYPTTAATAKLTQTAITQPALFVIEYALAKLWMAWGVHPAAMIGHSIGEYVAATLAGVFSLKDALALVAMRGKLMQELASGSMLAVFLPEAEITPLLNANLSLAAKNAPGLCVVSGTHAAIQTLHQQLTAQGVECRTLHTSHAFHSHMINPIIEEFSEYISKISLHAPQIPFISNVTGTWITTAQATDPHYWSQHLRQTVRFAEGIAELEQKPEQIFLEVGPGKVLSNLVKQQTTSQIVISSLRHPQEEQSDLAFLLQTLGRLWQVGIEVNWQEFYHGQRRYRIPLPTYPFEKQKFWLEPPAQAANINPEIISNNINDWFYIPVWKQSISLVQQKIELQNKSWLIFIDDLGLGTEFVNKLQQQEQDVITVQTGERFTKLSHGVYTINPQIKDDYEALIQDLHLNHQIPNMIAHCWGITASEQTLSDIDLGFWSLIFLAQALGQQTINSEVQIMVITNNLHNVTGEENLCLEKNTVLGACKVIGQEFPHLTCRNIDVIIQELARYKDRFIEKILSEFTSNSQDLVVAYRGRHRWVQTFEKTQLEKPSLERSPLQQKGVYLITGGLGGIGLALGEYLAQTVQAKLVLIGRSDFPQRDRWAEWLVNYDTDNPISQKIRKLQTWENLGAEVLVFSADITNQAQMQAIKNQVLANFGTINGVIHAAGVPGGGIIQLKTPQMAAKVLAPKVQGTQVINTVFGDETLDFIVLCSSLAAILGGFGQVDYCAANSFLDGFAQSKSWQRKPVTICINWCGWQEVGMLANTAIPTDLQQRREQHLERSITVQEGVEIFSRIIASQLPQIAVSKQNLPEQIRQNYDKVNVTAELSKLEKNQVSQQLHPRPQLSNEYIAPRTEIEQNIAKIWQDILGLEKVGIKDNFFDLGGHSLLATQVSSQLRKTFLVEIPLSSLFSESSTIENLAETIEQLITEKIEQLSEEEVQRLLGV